MNRHRKVDASDVPAGIMLSDHFPVAAFPIVEASGEFAVVRANRDCFDM